VTQQERKRVWPVYEAACDLPVAERADFVERSLTEAHLREKVLDLLATADQPIDDEDSREVPSHKEWERLGQSLGRFQLLAPLGRGGMGEVYEALDPDLGRHVAVKCIPSRRLQAASAVESLTREARVASALNHPGIVTIFEVIRTSDTVGIVMELVEGEPLRKLTGAPHPVPRVALWGQRIAEALAATHARGIIHRDIKPENLILRSDGYVKVLDFGLAAEETARPAGTLRYMSPEQSEASLLTPATDIFSLGIVLYELAAGVHPFAPAGADTSTLTIVRAAAAAHALPPSAIHGALPRQFDLLLLEMLEKDPALRPTAGQVASRLARIASASATPAWKTAVRKYSVPLAAAALLAAAGIYRFTRSSSPPPLPGPVPVTNYAGVESEPAVSPDGSRVAFIWTGLDDRSNLYAKSIHGEDPQRLTGGPREESSPAWSPDGKWIAFGRRAVDGGDEDVLVVPAAGGAARLVGHVVDHQGYRGIAWWPDGRSLVIRDATSQDNPLFRLFLDGSKRQLTDPAGGQDSRPAISPDGRTLAFVRSKPGTRSICRMSLPGGPQACVPEDENPRTLAWLGDSRALLVANRLGLWELPLRGRSVKLLDGSISDIATSADGTQAVFGRSAQDINIWRLDVSSRAVSRFIASNGEDSEPSYSPDGNAVLFRSDRAGRSQLYVANREGGSIAQLTHLPGEAGSARWSPDGRWIAFDYYAPPNGKTRIYLIPAAGGDAHPLTDDRSERMVPGWSADGKWVMYTVEQGQKRETWKVPFEGGPEVRVSASEMFDPVASPDGRWIYYTRPRDRARGLWKRPAGGGPELMVPGSEDLVYRCWDIQLGRLFFLQAGPKPGFARLDLRTSALTLLGAPPKSLFNGPRHVAASPDGKSVLFTQLDTLIGDLYGLDIRKLSSK
jgi:Tol biopolymer transport system component